MKNLAKYLPLYISEARRYCSQIVKASQSIDANALPISKDLHSLKGMAKALHLNDQVSPLTVLEDLVIEKKWDEFRKGFHHFQEQLETWIKTVETPEKNGNAIRFSDLVMDLKNLRTDGTVEVEILQDCTISNELSKKLFSWLQILMNNSVAHGYPNQLRPPHFRIGLKEDPPGIFLLHFEDNGEGIPVQKLKFLYQGNSDDLERLLTLLCKGRVSTTSQVSTLAGRGVGLSSLHDDVVALGGQLKLVQTSSKGTEFHARFKTESLK